MNDDRTASPASAASPASVAAAAADPAARPPRASATLVVVRDAPVGFEVLLLRRAERGDHNSGAWVFPGGIVDARDRDAAPLCSGLDDAQASRLLGLESGGIGYFVAAVRECFEESGLLFAYDAPGVLLAPARDAAAQLADWRAKLHRGERSMADLCRDEGLTVAADRLAYFSHWLTPPGRAKRFDTRFFIAEAPPAQTVSHDGIEAVEHRWMSPADALARAGEGDAFKLMTPTQKTLEAIARFDRAAALLEWARAPRTVPLVMPRVGVGAQGPRPVTPDEPAWAEIGRIDPQGHGHASYDIRPGVAVRLSPHLVRVTAHNGSVMTGPGTNTYLVGGGPRNEWAVIDPGPADKHHVRAVLAAAPGPVKWILATHTHMDHSPAVALLKAETGAAVYGRRPAHPEWQDASFEPDHELAGGERLTLDEGITLRAIHTPGHASNHLCYLFEQERTLFTGDHVMQQSTVVINPPDGDMAAYIGSLRALLRDEADALQWLAPGHGFLMAEPRRALQWIVEHRLKREAKVLDALRDLGPATVEQLLVQVYDDVPARMHGVATRSLKAHLLKLRDEGRARHDGGADELGRWALAR